MGVVCLVACTRPNPEHELQQGETCTAPASCARGSYSMCSTADQCRYLTSDGTSIPCGSCESCAGAIAAVGEWCVVTTNGSTTNGSTTNGSTTPGSTTNGSTTNGSTTNGSTTNGSTTGTTTLGPTCDILTQNCAAGSTPKCTILNTGTDAAPTYEARCVPLAGSIGTGQPCTSTEIGHDSCAAGLLCIDQGRATGDLRCTPLCQVDANCPASSLCAGLTSLGYCVPTCTLFGSGCSTGLTCSAAFSDTSSNDLTQRYFMGCRSPGVSNSSCTDDTDCVTGSVCAIDGTGVSSCALLCDSAHACADTSTSCMPQGSLPNGGGLCD